MEDQGKTYVVMQRLLIVVALQGDEIGFLLFQAKCNLSRQM